MKKLVPYAEEIKALKQMLRDSTAQEISNLRKRRHACILDVYRVRMAWSEINQAMVEWKSLYYLKGAKFHDGRAYNSWDIKLTQDRTEAELFDPAEAVAISKSLPFETRIYWTYDTRKRCPVCDSVCDAGFDDDGHLFYTCRKDKKHEVPK